MEKILVTGADGFLGVNLVNALIKRKYEVYALVYDKNKCIDKYIESEKLHVIECDLMDMKNEMLMIPSGFAMMYHLAWHGVDASSRKNISIQMKNIEITLKCMEIACLKKVKRIVMPGSTNEYLYCGQLINGFATPTPADAYGSVKVALQFLCRQITKDSNIEFVYCVITGIYSADRNDNNVIYYVIKKLLNKECPKLTMLEQCWDYIYIDDAIEGLCVIGEKGIDGKIYALGKGDNMPLREYIEIIHRKIDDTLPLGIGEIPYLDERIPSSCIDLSELEKDTGFIPKIEFEDGIEKVINNMRMRKYE